MCVWKGGKDWGGGGGGGARSLVFDQFAAGKLIKRKRQEDQNIRLELVKKNSSPAGVNYKN